VLFVGQFEVAKSFFLAFELGADLGELNRRDVAFGSDSLVALQLPLEHRLKSAPDEDLRANSSEDGGSGLLTYVVMTTEAAVGSTGALRRRMAAEMRVMIRPTGRGSMKV
jgi:hypothetical protein